MTKMYILTTSIETKVLRQLWRGGISKLHAFLDVGYNYCLLTEDMIGTELVIRFFVLLTTRSVFDNWSQASRTTLLGITFEADGFRNHRLMTFCMLRSSAGLVDCVTRSEKNVRGQAIWQFKMVALSPTGKTHLPGCDKCMEAAAGQFLKVLVQIKMVWLSASENCISVTCKLSFYKQQW